MAETARGCDRKASAVDVWSEAFARSQEPRLSKLQVLKAREAYEAGRGAYEAFRLELAARLPGRASRARVMELGQSMYRVFRRSTDASPATAVVRAAGDAVGSGMAPETAAAVAMAALAGLGCECGPGFARRLRRYLGSKQTRREGAMSETNKVVSAPASAQRRRNRARKTASDTSVKRVLEPTPLELHRREMARDGLRQALAGHQPVVRLCVAERLLKGASHAELCERYGLDRAQLDDMFAQMRPWVRGFTVQFDADHFWVEGARRSLLEREF
ncbi:hypothetical protein FJY71_04755 [candidate division WOR-3 bacterium]|nr:hypothetical protein [candidate division WOR-3 bacterium]